MTVWAIFERGSDRLRPMNTLCGIDEAGRGCLAGPLVVAGVVLRGDIAGLMDSKILSPKKREALFDVILKEALHHHIVIITPEEIDHTGISGAMRRALTEIREAVSAATYLFDGNTPFGVERITCQVKADRDIPAVSAASILAKVTKDRELLRLGADYPHYGF